MVHSEISPSKIGSVINCPATIKQSRGIKKSTNTMAERGTDIHNIGELLLEGKTIPSNTPLEYVDIAQGYADYCNNLKCIRQEVELKVNLSDLGCKMWGHLDFGGIDKNGTLHIVDLKTGFNIVEAERNSQLLTYTHGALKEFEGVKDIKLHIYQNSGNMLNISTYVLDLWELEHFIKHLVKPAINDSNSKYPNYNPSTDNCKWCEGKLTCIAFTTYSQNLLEGIFEDSKTIKTVLDIREFILKGAELEKVINMYKSSLLSRLETGETLQGFDLDRVKSRQKLDECEELISLLMKFGDKELFYKTTIKTPKQIKSELTDKQIEQIEKFIFTPEGKSKLKIIGKLEKSTNIDFFSNAT